MSGSFGWGASVRCLIGSAMVLLGARMASASVWYVSPWGSDSASGQALNEAFQTLQYAVDRSGAGDVIYADQGTYNMGYATGYPESSPVAVRVALNKAVELESLFGAETTIIEGVAHAELAPCGPNAMRGVFMGPGARLRGFTIRNGHTSATPGDVRGDSGGGIFALNNTYIYDCVIERSSALFAGGGAYGGEYNRCRFVRNRNIQGGFGVGGGVSSATLYQSQIVSNDVEGASLFSAYGAHGGGAAYSTLYNCHVEGNRVWNGLGGGLYQCTAYNGVILNNDVDMLNPGDDSPYRGYGGGVYGGQTFNCTIALNSASKEGGGAAGVTNGVNCVIVDNVATWGNNNHFYSTLSYSSSQPAPPGTGNIPSTPQFVGASAGNYRLTSGAPCRNAGQWMAWMDYWPWDFDRNLRISGATVDIGAFEYIAGTGWDDGYQDLGSGWRRLAWFGDYVPMGSDGWIWHNKHGFLFATASSAPSDIWFYSQDMGWLWTGGTTYPFLYRAGDGAWLWYNGSRNPRWFVNMGTGLWESRP